MRNAQLLRRFAIAGALIGAGAAIAGCPDFGVDLCSGAACPGDSDGGGDGSTDGSPPACDPSKDPSCVSDATGVFVNGASGSDSNAGTKESPLQTIGAAFSKTGGSKNNVFICAGTYAEHVKITSAVNLVGGFACADWSYAASNKPKVAPTDVGYALDIESVSSAVAVSDIEFDAQPGTTTAPSSIAAFASSSPQVKMTRVTLTAAAGTKGADGSSSAATTLPPGLKGNNADGGAGGLEQTCPCPDGNSVGGKGGNFVAGQLDGEMGQPNLNGTPPNNGAGGTGNVAACTSVGAGGIGATGADGDAGVGGPSAAGLGTLDASGFHPLKGTDGTSGGRGQGGGGGGTKNSGGDGAGGGGCGGCGGALGGGGLGGGASIALVALNSPVSLVACVLEADVAGDGGKGGDGQTGALGGTPGGDPNFLSCNGGGGGNGGAGGSGGGGAGGISVGIVYNGSAPNADNATQTSTKTAGHGGAAGAGGQGNGVEGVAQATLEIN